MKRYLTIAAASLLALPALAQNFNPKVEVTNDYETKMTDVVKKDLRMNIPDSLLKFDYNFDYSVFANPYKGAYEFSPYTVQMTPEPAEYDGSRFYLKAGAGYSIHPVLQAVYSPVPSGSFLWSIYQDLGGYYGAYRNIGLDLKDAGGDRLNGYDFEEKLGFAGQKTFRALNLGIDAHYDGIFNGLDQTDAMYNSGALSASFKSRGTGAVSYDGTVGASYGADNLESLGAMGFGINGTVGYTFMDIYNAFLDVNVNTESVSGDYFDHSFAALNLTPRFAIAAGFIDFSLGVKLGSSNGFDFNIYPDVRASVKLFKGASALYASYSGGNYVTTYSDFKHDNHFFGTGYYQAEDLFGSREKLNARGGIRGHFGSKFQYDLGGGYVSYVNNPVDALMFGWTAAELYAQYADYSLAHVDLCADWKSDRFDLDADVHFRQAYDMPDATVAPSMISGKIAATLNWNRRLFIGLSASGETERAVNGYDGVSVPAYVDLGVHGEYWFNRKFSAWIKGGNLLDQTIQITPLYAESGINFTAGICLKIR